MELEGDDDDNKDDDDEENHQWIRFYENIINNRNDDDDDDDDGNEDDDDRDEGATAGRLSSSITIKTEEVEVPDNIPSKSSMAVTEEQDKELFTVEA